MEDYLKLMWITELISRLEGLRIDVEANSFGEPYEYEDKLQRANEMLDDCINVVKKFLDEG